MYKFLIFTWVLYGNVFALSLGDYVTANTIASETTMQSVMKLSIQSANMKEYTINKASGTTKVLVNKHNIAYGFSWQDTNPDLASMLGPYTAEFHTAYANQLPNKFNNRMLVIDSTHLYVKQFGLPGGKLSGKMYAKDLMP